MLKQFSIEESKKGILLMSYGVYLSKDMCPRTHEERELMNRILQTSMIGSIMFAMLCTRLDVSRALIITSRYQANPREKYWIEVKNIFKYLRRTKDIFLIYVGPKLIVQGYTDSSFLSDRDDYKSQSSYMFMLNDGAAS